MTSKSSCGETIHLNQFKKHPNQDLKTLLYSMPTSNRRAEYSIQNEQPAQIHKYTQRHLAAVSYVHWIKVFTLCGFLESVQTQNNDPVFCHDVRCTVQPPMTYDYLK